MERAQVSLRTRWAALGAAVAVTLGAGTIGIVDATTSTGERTVLTTITACRLTDTRSTQVDPRTTPLQPGETVTYTTHGTNGQCNGIPTDAVALQLNVTALDATQTTFWTFWSSGPRPNASNLNPEPGQPPTPNAVTVDLTTTGTFNLYNNAGTVNALIDITGYYTDHNHDDRYYTKTEADGRFVSSTAPTQIKISPFAMKAGMEGSMWSLGSGWQHMVSGSDECILADPDLPVGSTVTGMTVRYFEGTVQPTLDVALVGLRNTVGPTGGDVFRSLTQVMTSAPVDPANISPLAIPITGTGSPLIDENFDYAVSVCTKDKVAILGIDIALA